MSQKAKASLAQIMACRLFSAKPLSKPMLDWTLGTNINEILIEIHTFSFNDMYLKMSSGKWPPFCLGLNVSILYQAFLQQVAV